MRDIPVVTSGYTFMVTGEPEGKTNPDGSPYRPKDRNDVELDQPFVVMLLAKPKPVPGQPRRKDGEEIKVNLPCDPGEGFDLGTFVELINPVINTFEMRDDDGRISNAGIWWKADGLKPATRPVATKPPAGSGSAASAADKASKAA
ncbi:hypothetical protein [Thermocrispum municipale]|uniref:hypothetical protein n=1 Tax=Thermocrispum municipale TaxID=37926 RepID=UPI0003FE11B0|nr:hypothetical protein [Thermocrispum municipale]